MARGGRNRGPRQQRGGKDGERIPLRPEQTGPANTNSGFERRYLIDADQLGYNVPAQVNLNVNIVDAFATNRPVSLSIQNIDVAIKAVEIEPLMVNLNRINGTVDAISKQILDLAERIGQLEEDETVSGKLKDLTERVGQLEEGETIIARLRSVPT